MADAAVSSSAGVALTVTLVLAVSLCPYVPGSYQSGAGDITPHHLLNVCLLISQLID